MKRPHFRLPHDSVPMRIGAFEITKTGASRYDLRDPYHLAVTLTWPRFFLMLFSADLLINAIFALLYMIEPGSVSNTRPGSFIDMFFFSMETLATVGYGVSAPVTLYGHLIASAEIMCGLTFTAIVTGLIFVRFSRPKSKIMFAEKAVVTNYNGKPTLMVRIGNGRMSLLANAVAHLNAIMKEESPENMTFRRVHELRLVRQELTVFAMTWTLLHELDETSPLYGLSPELIQKYELRLVAFAEAHDHALGVRVNQVRNYSPEDILLGMRYQDAVTIDEATGRANADLTKIGAVEPDEVPSFSREAALFDGDQNHRRESP
jgi:inward rectifier potassium channel